MCFNVFLENRAKAGGTDEDGKSGGQENDGSGQESNGSGQENDGSGQENDGSGQENDGRGQENDGSGQKDDGSGQENDGSGQENDGSGQENDGSEYSPSIISATTMSKKSSLSLLTDKDSALFNTFFKKIIHSSKQITQKAVYDVLTPESQLFHLTKQFTFRQLADKVSTARRAIARNNQRNKLSRKNRK